MKNILKSEEYDINAPKFKLAFGWMLEIVELGYFIDADVIAISSSISLICILEIADIVSTACSCVILSAA